jgi:dipeptidyl aminopeptidase/acylaminoacyl peptidase
MMSPRTPGLFARILMSAVIALLSTSAAQSARAQQPRFELTIQNIMRGPEHIGQAPGLVRWSDDGQWIYFRWLPGGHAWDDEPKMYRVAARGGEPVELTDRQADSVGVLLAGGPLSPDGRRRAVTYQGDLHLIERATLATRRLTLTRAIESSPVFRNDGRALYYLSDNNLFELDIERGGVRQITDLRSGPAPSDPRPAQGQRGFLEDQQKQLFEYIRRQAERAGEARVERREDEARAPLQPMYLEREERVTDLTVEPNGTYAVITTTRPASGTQPRRVSIPFWVTESGFTEPRDVRTKVGDVQSNNGRMGIVSLAGDTIHWIDFSAATATEQDADTTRAGSDNGRELAGVRLIGWNDAGTAGLIAASSADFKDAWLWSFDAASGRLTLLHHLHDDAWVAGPCAFWGNCSGWLPDSRTIWFASERDGFNHLYTIRADGTGERQLTRGNWEVHNVEIAARKDRFWITSNEGSPFEVHFYHMDFDGSDRVRVTTMTGRQDVTPSPDGARIAFVHSTSNTPPELYVADNRADASATRITTSPTAEWRSFDWISPEIVMVDASDGVKVPARFYKPSDMGAQPNGAAVIFVHGAGYLQNVHNWWSSYYREYMFHHILASKGYYVLDLDYRASSGYGRDWRTAIYRHMGGKDLSDQVDGSRWLQQTHGIDPERVGIYGGSYGGFITLMALFTAPERFGAGAALRSVTDWAHYNHGYTGRILNLPQNDSVAYRQSSPIYFAEGLDDPLLIAHGMVDTNVHFSDVVRLAQRLIELGKRNWEMAVYPVEDHGFTVPSSWTDEYRRILELFERHINPRGDPASVR